MWWLAYIMLQQSELTAGLSLLPGNFKLQNNDRLLQNKNRLTN